MKILLAKKYRLRKELVMVGFSLGFIIISCVGRNNAAYIDKGKHMAAFVQARSVSSGLESPDYGDIIILDLDSAKQTNVTDDLFFDLTPKWSPLGGKLLFQSNRKGDKLSLDIKGIGGPYEIYIYDFEKQQIQEIEIPYEKERPRYLRSTLEDLQWYDEDMTYVFTFPGDNGIYKTTIGADTSFVFRRINKFGEIGYLSVCPYTKAIAFEFEGAINDPQSGGIAYIDSMAIDVQEVCTKWTDVGGWSDDGLSLLYCLDNTIYAYHLQTKKHEKIFQGGEEYEIDRPYYVDGKRISFLARHEDQSELYVYDSQSKTTKRLTNNGLQKKWLCVSSGR